MITGLAYRGPSQYPTSLSIRCVDSTLPEAFLPANTICSTCLASILAVKDKSLCGTMYLYLREPFSLDIVRFVIEY